MRTSLSFVMAVVLGLLSAVCFAADAITQAPQVAMGSPYTNPQIVSEYQKTFRSWQQLNWGDCTPCASISPSVYCPCGLWNATWLTATKSTPHSTPVPSSTASATVDDSYVSAAGTVTRTILVRLPDGSVQTDPPKESTDTAVQAAGTHPSNAKLEDVTSWFWEDQISGHDSRVIPITVEHPTSPSGDNTEPIVLLAWVNTTVLSSFISLPLVRDLNLSSIIRSIDEEPAYPPERDLAKLFGGEVHAVGVVTIHLLAGKNNKAREAQFIVADGPPDKTGALQVDIMLGMHLLNSLGAVGLTSEYTGSDAAGAKEGLGILVERVIKVEVPRVEKVGHDEL